MYVYTQNNPISFVDPLGLKLIVDDPSLIPVIKEARKEIGPIVDAIENSKLPVYVMKINTQSPMTNQSSTQVVHNTDTGQIQRPAFGNSFFEGREGPGTGVGSFIFIDTNPNGDRPTSVKEAVEHEFAHALKNMYGTQQPRESGNRHKYTPAGEALPMIMENIGRTNSRPVQKYQKYYCK